MNMFGVLNTPIIIKYYMVLLVGLIFAGFAMMICIWVRHPRAWLKKMYLKLFKGKDTIPVAIITSTNSLVVDVMDKKKVLTRNESTDAMKTMGYIPIGEDINIAGLGRGYAYFEECNLPLAISASALRNKMVEIDKGKHGTQVDYSMLDAKLLGNLIVSYAQLAMQSGIAKARKGAFMLQYVTIGAVVIAVGLIALVYMQQQQLVAAINALLNLAPGTGGTEYGIKP